MRPIIPIHKTDAYCVAAELYYLHQIDPERYWYAAEISKSMATNHRCGGLPPREIAQKLRCGLVDEYIDYDVIIRGKPSHRCMAVYRYRAGKIPDFGGGNHDC